MTSTIARPTTAPPARPMTAWRGVFGADCTVGATASSITSAETVVSPSGVSGVTARTCSMSCSETAVAISAERSPSAVVTVTSRIAVSCGIVTSICSARSAASPSRPSSSTTGVSTVEPSASCA